MTKENTLDSLEIYQIALDISDKAWDIYHSLPKNFQYHIGNQFLDAADSIGATISEGYGRYHYKDSINFNYYARGSSFETRFWVNRLFQRKLITEEVFSIMGSLVGKEITKINSYNNYLRSRIKK